MEYIRRNGQSLYEYIVSRFQYDETVEAEERSRNMFLSLLNPVESYVISIQSLLIWERPYVTTLILVVVTCLFWLNAYIFKRFYSFLAVTALVVYVYRLWVNIVWPQIRVPPPEEEDTEGWTPVHPQVLSAPELSRYLDDGWNSIKDGIAWFWDLRNRNHGVFCFIVSSVFFLLCLLGHFVPGIVIVYTLLLGIMIGPGIVLYVIPGSWYDQLRDTLFPAFRRELRQDRDSDSDVEEFVPNVDSIVLSQLSLQHEDSPGREGLDTACSFEQAVARELGMQDFTKEDEDISLYQGLENFPSVEEEEESGDEVELPQPENNDESNGIKIIPTYYKIESSDSENELFSAGLTFTDVENTDSNSQDDQKNKKDNDKQSMADAADNLQQSLSSDIDIDEYEIVSKSDLTS